MHRTISLMLLIAACGGLLGLTRCQQAKPRAHGTSLTVKVEGFHPKGMQIMQVYNQHYDHLQPLAQAASGDGQTFTWCDSSLALDIYALLFDAEEMIVNPQVYVFLGDGPVEITVTRSPYGVLTSQSKGSALQARYEQYTTELRKVTLRNKIDSVEYLFYTQRSQNDTVGMAELKESTRNLYKQAEVNRAQYLDSVGQSATPDFFSFYLYYANQLENHQFTRVAEVANVEKSLERWQGDSLVQASPLLARVRGALEAAKPSLEGSPAPDFQGETLQGDTLALSSLRGKVVLVEFWASYCGWCRQEWPSLKAAYQTYHQRKGVEFLSVSTDSKREAWVSALEKAELPWAQVRLETTTCDQVLRSYNITGIPLILLVDGQGTIVKRGLRGDEVAMALEQLPDAQ